MRLLASEVNADYFLSEWRLAPYTQAEGEVHAGSPPTHKGGGRKDTTDLITRDKGVYHYPYL